MRMPQDACRQRPYGPSHVRMAPGGSRPVHQGKDEAAARARNNKYRQQVTVAPHVSTCVGAADPSSPKSHELPRGIRAPPASRSVSHDMTRCHALLPLPPQLRRGTDQAPATASCRPSKMERCSCVDARGATDVPHGTAVAAVACSRVLPAA